MMVGRLEPVCNKGQTRKLWGLTSEALNATEAYKGGSIQGYNLACPSGLGLAPTCEPHSSLVPQSAAP